MIIGRPIPFGPPSLEGRPWWALGLVVGAGVGLGVGLGPMAMVLAGIVTAFIGVVVLGPRIVPVFHGGLVAILIGYAALNRGFAYLGAGGVYVGEIVLLLALIALIVSLPRARFGAGEIAIIAFMAWGAATTVPYIGLYELDALRDAVAWGYALIALALSVSLTTAALGGAVRLYRRLALPLLLWLPVAAVAAIALGEALPTIPGGQEPILAFKGGDAGVHLAGIAAFVLTGLYGDRALAAGRSIVLWAAWLACLGLVAAVNRGGMVAASMAAFSSLFVRRVSQWVIAACVASVLLCAAWLTNPQVDLGIQRQLSFQQLVENATSIFVDRPSAQTQATKAWRIEWWESIVEYTVGGPYLWTGKGYGVNLADDDGFQVQADGSLRSPHSAHLEILARSGLPGLLLWLGVNLAVAAALIRAGRRAWLARRAWWLAVVAWLTVYWLAALMTMSVDVYLAGPMGGIWFWAIVGTALAVGRLSRGTEPSDPAASVGGTPPAAAARANWYGRRASG